MITILKSEVPCSVLCLLTPRADLDLHCVIKERDSALCLAGFLSSSFGLFLGSGAFLQFPQKICLPPLPAYCVSVFTSPSFIPFFLPFVLYFY